MMNPQRKPMMAGNWKMYKTADEAANYLAALNALLNQIPNQKERPDIVICPPFTSLDRLGGMIKQQGLSSVALGAQNMATCVEGAYTGEVSPVMLLELGVTYVILGHSERREYYHETNEAVITKIRLALHHGLTPIVCVGESLSQRESGETDSWVQHQVMAALDGFTNEQRRHMVFAYEPIWAIGTGQVCEADEANRVIGLIREAIGVPDVRVLYGGSVKPDNVEGLMRQPEIDGGLVGGASLDPQSFIQLIQAAMPLNV